MTWVYVGTAAATVVAAKMSSDAQKRATAAQVGSAQAGIQEQQYEFDKVQKLLEPYAAGGQEAIGAQRALLGLKGPEEQQTAITQLQQSPAYTSGVQAGEESILQNAAATGGLRGGNVQEALTRFRPQLLSQLIQQQFQNLGGLTTVGENAAAGTGTAAQTTGANVANLLQQQGAAQAAGGIAQANTFGQTAGNLAGLFAAYKSGKPAPTKF